MARIKLPQTVRFEDYSAVALRGRRIAVLSQQSSRLWIGTLRFGDWTIAGEGKTYEFPRTKKGKIKYGTLEGLCWLTDRSFVCVSDLWKGRHRKAVPEDGPVDSRVQAAAATRNVARGPSPTSINNRIAMRLVVIAFGILALTYSTPESAQSPLRADATAPVFGYAVQRTYPHDAEAFTQGLEYVGGYLYESTGLNGRSSIRKVTLETGKVLRQRAIPPDYFGEGITIWKSALIELTWQSQVAFVYDRDTFEPRRTFTYTGEGWGLTHDATNLIMSDGTADLRFLDPETFKERRRITVTDGGRPVPRLNELEYVKGQVFANIWTTDDIVRIDPASGRVLGRIDLRGLLPDSQTASDVLNGIAYDQARDRLFVTGKLWPKLFEIKIRPR